MRAQIFRNPVVDSAGVLSLSLSLFPAVENEKKEMGQCDDDDKAMGDPMS